MSPIRKIRDPELPSATASASGYEVSSNKLHDPALETSRRLVSTISCRKRRTSPTLLVSPRNHLSLPSTVVFPHPQICEPLNDHESDEAAHHRLMTPHQLPHDSHMSRSNACLVCRARKVRCDRVAGGTSKCSTCIKLDRECVAPKWTPEITWPSDNSASVPGDYIRSVDTTSRGLHLFSGKLESSSIGRHQALSVLC